MLRTFVQRDVPLGTISSFSGSIANIPATFRLCDGTHGTPDLRNKFIVGSGDTYAVGSGGGSQNHQHDFNSVGHVHSIVAGTDINSGPDFFTTTTSDQAVGTTDNKDGRPPFYSLAFMMYAGRSL